MHELPDAELVQRARAGDKAAFGVLAERYAALAEHVAYGLLGHAEYAREQAQEALLQAYLSLDRLRDPERFRGWLYGIVLNVCRLARRAEKISYVALEELAGGLAVSAATWPEAPPDPAAVAEERELAEALHAALAGLSTKDREAALLFYYGQLSLREIAGLLGISVAAVKGRLHNARTQLRTRLWDRYAAEYALLPHLRRASMIQVTVADVIRRPDPEHPQHIVMLLDEAGGRVLPIWIGPAEAVGIALGLRGGPGPRPMTYHFMNQLIAASDARIEAVHIAALKENVFYATVLVRQGNHTREVDARPSDALGLAVSAGSPIYVAEEILAEAGHALPAAAGDLAQLGRGMASLVEEVQQQFRSTREKWQKVDKAKQELEWQELSALAFGPPAADETARS